MSRNDWSDRDLDNPYQAPVEAVGREIFEKVLAVASGERTKSELNGVGEEEFAPWSIGPTL